MPNPHLQGWIAASVPKAGSRAEENEDATAADAKRVRFAIADGATEGWQSGGWAQHLAKSFLANPPGPTDFEKWVASVRATWTPPASTSAAWYAEVKSEQGSYATLLGLEFRLSNQRLVWKAVAVGDTCLFVIRGARLEISFPVDSVEAFGNQPSLVPSSNDHACPEPEWLAGWSEPGDLFLIASDAAAKFILESGEDAGTNPLVARARRAVASGSASSLVELLHELRPRLNDDASVIAIRVASDATGRSIR